MLAQLLKVRLMNPQGKASTQLIHLFTKLTNKHCFGLSKCGSW